MTTRYHVTPISGNAKTGKITVTSQSRDTCWNGCAFHRKCYAEDYRCGFHWDRIDRQGVLFPEFVARLSALPDKPNQPARFGEKGDLPGVGATINRRNWNALRDVFHESARRWFAYTHKPADTVTATLAGSRIATRTIHVNRDVIGETNAARDITLNLSANSLQHADTLAALNVGPVVAVAPASMAGTQRTPEGRAAVQCPATYRDDVSCGGGTLRGRATQPCGGSSGPLCWQPDRAFIVYFPAHGSRKRAVTDTVTEWSV